MSRIVPVLAVAGHLAAIQLVFGALGWWLSPWPALALGVALGWLVVMALDLRHPRLAGHLPRWPLAIALILAELPALVFGAWNILYFLHVAPRFELGACVVQLWLNPIAPLLALCPHGACLGRDLWLWVLSGAPFVLVALGMLANRSADFSRHGRATSVARALDTTAQVTAD